MKILKFIFFIFMGTSTMFLYNIAAPEKPVEEVAQPDLISTP
tara:strand:- start:252 stop:377 length:126 start_codon:yes stop_codon:yes gene_type:complete